jgi:hypothetical protein
MQNIVAQATMKQGKGRATLVYLGNGLDASNVV